MATFVGCWIIYCGIHPVEHRADIEVKGDVANVSFLPVVPNTIRVQVEQVESTSTDTSTPDTNGRPIFGPRPDTQSTDFNFEAEVKCLPFKLNSGDEAKLTCIQQSWFIDLIYDHPEVFSLHDEDLRFCNWIKHTIPIMMDKPVYLAHHTIPPQLQGEVYKCLDTWLQQGIIRPSQSPYASQVVIVWKKTGEIHLCLDYHKLNSITVRDAFPLPRTDEALQAVASSNWFSPFYLAQGYLQLEMEESDIKKTAFRASSMGLYEFTHMPFGLSNAGSSFCHLMEQCLGDQQFVTLLLYLDDICIFAPTIDDMLDQIHLVFDMLKKFNLKIKPKKCQFFSTSVLFLGHVLLAEGISANPDKVDKVKTWPVPKNIKEVQSFLGLASYYRHFILHFAEKAWCLHELVGPTASKPKIRTKARNQETQAAEAIPSELEPNVFEWMIEHQEAFDALKETLCTAPVLGYPDFNREFILEPDASLKGLGAILSQQQKDGSIHVIAYASWSLCPSERSMCNYSSAKLELLMLKWDVTEKFWDYLLGSWFQVYTDNNPLSYIQESKLGASQIWWLSELALFNFTIKYQTGHSNRATDTLSHCPFNPSCNFKTESTDSNEVEVISYSATCNGVETIPYSLVCEALDQCLNGSKIPEVLKQEAQQISCVVQSIVEEEYKQEINETVSGIDAVSVFGKVSITRRNEGGAAKRSYSQTGL